MRIISKFKDYYDSGLAYGIDDDLVYVRETKEEGKATDQPGYLLGTQSVSGARHTIFFCGKAYRHVELYEHHCYSLDDVDKVVAKFSKEQQDIYYTDGECIPKHKRPKYAYSRSQLYRSGFGEWFFHADYLKPKVFWQRNTIDPTTIQRLAKKECDSSGCPVIIARGEHRIYNPILRQYEFIRVKDPFTAFQEITAWLSNRANAREKIPAISNSDMIVSKGFDLKTSFRKDKRA